jgi:uncharacterized protein YacL
MGTARAEGGTRRRPSPLRVGIVLLGVVLLAPVWAAYGLLGKLLTTPSRALSAAGVALLAALAAVAAAQAYTRSDQLELTEDDASTRAVLFVSLAMLVALLLAQRNLHRLVMFCVDLPPNSPNGVSRLIDVVAPAFFIFMMWDFEAQLPHWQLVDDAVLCTLILGLCRPSMSTWNI